MLSYGDLDLIATNLALLAARAKTEMLPYNCRTNLIPTDLIFLQNTEISHSLPARLTALFLMKTTPLRFPTVQIQRQK